ncbi:5-formyltetrahydrofolate cyclo-ligase [Gudongella sp. DL1XJH-153]|uniref:5-formyltetrahydrofolate cyclo-ligase n=1 Tax=Gudongella sp. DL1XJH-153 TaxID=3409804 RepID=UPI003BB7A768
MDKKTIRELILQERSKLSESARKSHSRKIIDLLKATKYYKEAKVIMCFVSFNDELDTHQFIKEALLEGKRVIVPITVQETKKLIPSELMDFKELEPGYYNILTPKKEFTRPIEQSDIDLVVVPGVAFDPYGYRVGYGGGYYDRFLISIAKTVPKIAVGFGMQLVGRVPRESFDVPVDMIITEMGVTPCSEGLYETRA